MNPVKYWVVRPTMPETIAQVYFKSMDLDELLRAYETAVRCRHYCPCECRCFEDYHFEFDSIDVRNFILENYTHVDTQERGM